MLAFFLLICREQTCLFSARRSLHCMTVTIRVWCLIRNTDQLWGGTQDTYFKMVTSALALPKERSTSRN